MLSHQYKQVPCTSIIINRSDRQRREIDTKGLEESISKRGVLCPIIITEGLVLVAGERRLTASLRLGLKTIPARFGNNLTPQELRIIELEENVRRQDLSWQDQVTAVGRLHAAWVELDPSWTGTKTSEQLGYSATSGHVTDMLRVYGEMTDPKIAEMPSLAAAKNFLFRKDSRGIDNAMALIMEGRVAVTANHESGQIISEVLPHFPVQALAPLVVAKPNPSGPIPVAESILKTDFNSWAPTYSGPKFNFLHCDFPYGVGVFEGKQSGYQRADAQYDDSAETFWTLMETLVTCRDELMQASCHIMFWFSMDYYSEIFAFFRAKAPEFTINPFPLIWAKSCGSGITPDPKRGAKRSYETALLMSRGDRFVCRAPSNLYSAPTDKKYHPSTKPEPMLRHFFQLFVDEHTRMLDPTCGSGSSLRAAESMGAKSVLGLEANETFYKGACEALRNFRVLAAANKGSK